MSYKKIVPIIFTKGLSPDETINTAIYYAQSGADELILAGGLSDEVFGEEDWINIIKAITLKIDIPLCVRKSFERLEAVKKVLYAGAAKVMMPFELNAAGLLEEAAGRFGNEKILVSIDLANTDSLEIKEQVLALEAAGHTDIFIDNGVLSELLDIAAAYPAINLYCGSLISDKDEIVRLLAPHNIRALVNFRLFAGNKQDVMALKTFLNEKHVPVNVFSSAISFSEFKMGSDGLIPVITQDYKTGKVLMLAYMNEAAFDETIRSGRMTYYSRSRSELWKKGETSGHFQYVKSLDIDCDYDTILAKVSQVGAACHTGNESCFYTNLVKKEYDDRNPLTIFDDIMSTIIDRRENPKEGSYTNYLFEKGIDKILKKVGEEATEIVIAAKNPDDEELKYEISDFLYHVMVLMASRGLTWKEITKELAKRHG